MTLHYLDQPATTQEIFSFLAKEIKDWFTSRFARGFTQPQLYAIPSIHEKKNTLVFSSTGSGKTFAAFLAAINELFIESKKGSLKDQIYILYISPLKALGNDIRKNLEEPLQGIQDLAASNNIVTPKIRVAVRTGDTTQAERSRMLKTPPHILITTPESLGLILTSPKFSLHLKSVRWVVLDEIHEVSSNKRGALLSLFLEYLQSEIAENNFTRIGLSATQAPIEEIARFLVGRNEKGKENDCFIANLPPQRKLDLVVRSPVSDLLHTPYVMVQEGIYSILSDLVLDHETSIIFTNTRKGAESVAFKLKEFLGDEYAPAIAVHHSSLSREIRLDVEDKLKNNELIAAVTSTSLELGIDIGSVELVSQIGSPKTVAKYLQRVGRSGHSLDRLAKGRLIVTDRDDAIECSVLTKSTYSHDIDKVQIPNNCLDVLAQYIVGISLAKRWNVDDAYSMIKRSYNYRDLSFVDYINVLEYLGGYNLEVEERKVYRKIWYDHKENSFGKKKGTRLIFYTNIGTIPESADFRVELETYRTRIGFLSEKFVERLSPGDIFVLGSHTYQFKRTVGSRVVVSEAFGRRPTIPNWVGEELPRSFELSQQIGRFIEVVAQKIQDDDEEGIKEWIERSFQCDDVIAKTIIEYIKEQLAVLNMVPSDKRLLIESFVDPQGRMNIVFHALYGRRVNDALSRFFAFEIGQTIDADVASAVNDNGFLLMLPIDKIIDTTLIPELVTSENLENILKKAIINTELFQTRFRHVASRALMVLRRSANRSVPLSRQSLYARRIFTTIREQDAFCVIKETYREILRDYMDLENAKAVIRKLQQGEFEYHITPLSDIPSPFAHGIVLLGVADIVQISDRSALLRELHQQVLAKVFGKEGTKEILFDRELVKRIFDNRSYKNESLLISSLKQLRSAIRVLTPIRTIESVPPSIYHLCISDPKQIRAWALALHNNGEILDVNIGRGERRAIPINDYPVFWNIYAKTLETTELDDKILSLLQKKHPLSSKEIAEDLNETAEPIKSHLEKLEQTMIISRSNFEIIGGRNTWKYILTADLVPSNLISQAKRLDPEECLKKIVLRYLKVHGPSTSIQIIDYLKIEEDKVTRALFELEQRNRILKGQIIEGSIEPQYIRLEDRELLRNLSSRKPESIILTPEELNYIHYYFTVDYYFKQKLEGKENVLNILNTFGSIEDLNSLAIRIQNFDVDWIRELINQNELIQGRLSHNRLGYVSRTMFPYYYVAYKDSFQLSRVEEKILASLRKYGPLTKREIKEFTEIDDDVAQESLMILDKSLHIIRKSFSFDSYLPRQFIPNVYDLSSRYLPSGNLPTYSQSQQFLLRNFIESLGPVSLVELTHTLGFKYSDIEKIIKILLEKDKIIERKLTERETNYYMTFERFKEITKLKHEFINTALKEDEKVVILARDDPFTKLGLRIHLRDVYGEGLIDPILLDGEVIGSLEYKLYKGQYLQIYDLKLDDEVIYHTLILQKIAAELVRYTRKIHRVLSLQIEDINGRSVLSKTNSLIKDTFIKTGFRLIKDTLVGGESITRVFPKKIIDKFVLDKLWLRRESEALNEERLVQLVNHFGFLSFEEILSRFPDTMSVIVVFIINKLLEERRIIYQGGKVYSLTSARYRKSGLRRRKKILPETQEVHNKIKKGYINFQELTNQWEGASVSLKSALSALETNMMISVKSINNLNEPQEYWDSSSFIPEFDEEISSVRTRYIYDIVNSLGVSTEAQIAERGSIPGILSKIKIREILADLIEEEKILVGRFVENDIHFYYITKENYNDLEMFEKRDETKLGIVSKEDSKLFYILHPNDIANLILREDYPERFDISEDNYNILINQRIAAQCKVKEINQRRTTVNNLVLAPWVQSEVVFNYVINALETIPKFYTTDTDSLIIERINGIAVQSLVK
ncbi:MAG: ATP-dependent helicase [Candidatus Heimdallarchaeota archaeon]